jgi:hypothetical protein
MNFSTTILVGRVEIVTRGFRVGTSTMRVDYIWRMCDPDDESIGIGLPCLSSFSVLSSTLYLQSCMKSSSEASTEPRRRDDTAVVQRILTHELGVDNDRIRVQKGLKQLADLCLMGRPNSCEAHRRTVYRAQGYHILVGALQRYMFFPVTVAEGCRCIQNSTMDMVDCQEAAMAAGALEVVARVLRRHGSDRYVQRVGCGALYALTKNHARQMPVLYYQLVS